MFYKAWKPTLWFLKLGAIGTVISMLINFNQGGAAIAEAMVGIGGATIMFSIVVYIISAVYFGVKKSIRPK
ncbi:hypothetical protein [Vibrio sp. B1Z05]|uniref:hypothetical protein n=1 Tax=Vibrio sp. B1Z05 TaxID=2654980 RepID=UPI00128B1076|nr:hypothetical protein [Vibrio sp. B1Z05]MPW35303.1 hypothetical protein [Vibrio sp. B1Z05]